MLEMINKFTILLPTSQLVALVGNNNYPPQIMAIVIASLWIEEKSWLARQTCNKCMGSVVKNIWC